MNSEHVSGLLHDYLDGSLSPAAAVAVMRHCESCPSCLNSLGELRALKRSLSQWPAPPARAGVLERMLNVAVRTPVARAPWWRAPIWNWAGLSAASAVLLMLGFGLGLRTAHRDQPGPQIVLAAQPVELGPEEHTVALMFRASTIVQNARISVWLPDGVQIAGRPDARQLSWQTDLKPGPNLLELPLLATGSHGGTLLVHLSQGSLVRALEVPITIRSLKIPPAASGLQRDPSALG